MPSSYRAFYVATFDVEPGKMKEALTWFSDAVSIWSRLPGVLSVTVYTTQFALGPRHGVEVWTEIEDYSALDRWDELSGQLQADFIAHAQAAPGVVRSGPARIVGDLVGSVPAPMGGTLGAAPESG